MPFLDNKELFDLYLDAVKEADIWRKDYTEYERLADNGLLSDLDENLPEVNDGTLAAALFQLPKRIVSTKLRGRAKAIDSADDWLSELASIRWEKHIVPRANMQAPFHRKWKDAVRKSAIYGGQPLITLFADNGDYEGSDFIVPLATDVKLEPGKVSDYDSDVIYWDVYYTKLHVEQMLEDAREDMKQDPKAKKAVKEPKSANNDGDADDDGVLDDGYNKWNLDALQQIIDDNEEEERGANEEASQRLEKGVKKSGIHFIIAFQRGVNAPFKMLHKATRSCIREWSNPDPTGDLPVHYLYCYQDFINPYGIGICKLAGGTQNVLDYMRQADVLATQLGLRPPKLIEGDDSQTDYDSLTYTEDADWIAGNAKIERMELANGVYNELPARIQMYKASLNQLIPTGNTSVGQGAGDPQQSKTHAGVQMQQAMLSIDDEDFKDNFYVTYAAVAKSMINTEFANMQGKDTMHLDPDERKLLQKAGIDFPIDGQGVPSSTLDLEWDKARASFEFIVDPSSDAYTDDAQQIETLTNLLGQINLQTMWMMGQDGYKFNAGEAYYSLFKLQNLDNFSKIIVKMDDKEAEQAKQQPFPIIDHPQIRLTGQIPSGAMPSALAQGGVNVAPNTPLDDNAPDLAALLKDPSTTISEKAQIKQRMGIQADPTAQAPAVTPQVDPQAELDLKQQELQIKQEHADNEKAKIVLLAHQQGHQQGMDQLQHVHSVNQASQPQTDPKTGKTSPAPKTEAPQLPSPHPDPLANDQQHQADLQAVMEQYHVTPQIAEAMLAAEKQGLPIDQIVAHYAGGGNG